MTGESLKIDVAAEANQRVVFLSGEIDLSNVARLIQTLQKVTESGESVVVDMAGVRYMDSQGVRALRVAYGQAMTSGGSLRLRGCQTAVKRVLNMVGLDRVIPLE